jgi:hypothetical protein
MSRYWTQLQKGDGAVTSGAPMTVGDRLGVSTMMFSSTMNNLLLSSNNILVGLPSLAMSSVNVA